MYYYKIAKNNVRIEILFIRKISKIKNIIKEKVKIGEKRIAS